MNVRSWKGVIDEMSSFGVKNILRHDIITQDIFFNDSEGIVNYIAQKKPEFFYMHVLALEVTAKRCEEDKPFGIKNCMRQHVMVFETGKNVILKEYLWERDPYRISEFRKCENKDSEADLKRPKQRQQGASGRWRIWRKLRWTHFWFRLDTIVRNFIH